MRSLPFVFLTFMLITPSLKASAEYPLPHYDDEMHAAQQRTTELLEGIKTLEIEEVEDPVTPKDPFIRLAGECRSMKLAVAKMLNFASLAPDKKYKGDHDEPIRKSLRIMITESSLRPEDKTEHMQAWNTSVFQKKHLLEFLNVYANGELKFLSRITPESDMPKDERELGMFLARRYLAYADVFAEHCNKIAQGNVFTRIGKSPKIASAYGIQSPNDSDENTSDISSDSSSEEEGEDDHDVNTPPHTSSSSKDREVSQTPNKYNYSEDYIRMNFREGENPAQT